MNYRSRLIYWICLNVPAGITAPSCSYTHSFKEPLAGDLVIPSPPGGSVCQANMSSWHGVTRTCGTAPQGAADDYKHVNPCPLVFCLLCFCRRDVFACIGLNDGDKSWEQSFSLWPLGVCDYLVPIQREFHPEEWSRRTRNLYNWSETHNRCRPPLHLLLLLTLSTNPVITVQMSYTNQGSQPHIRSHRIQMGSPQMSSNG